MTPVIGAPRADEIGKAAGVSTRTVSRFLSGRVQVSDAMKRRIETAMRELGYGTTRFGVISLHGASRGILEKIFRGIVEAAHDTAHEITLTDVVPNGAGVVSSILAAMAKQTREGVGGFVVVSTHEDVVRAVQEFDGDVPVVLALDDDNEFASIGIDSYNGAVQATRHLLALGHTRLAFVAGPRTLGHAQARERAFIGSLEEAGIDPVAIVDGDWTARSGLGAGRLLRETDATAVFCASDQMALGLMHAYSEVGKYAPGDISVVGYDDDDGAAFFVPPLTTVRQDYAEVGRRSYTTLVGLARGERRRSVHLVPELVVRSSTVIRPFETNTTSAPGRSTWAFPSSKV